MFNYDKRDFKGDLMGGIVAGVVALPLALAFGVQSGLGATAGLYGAIALGIFAALLGGTPTQASGPTGPMTVVSASLVVAVTEATGSLEAGLGVILLAFLLGGLFQVVFGLLNIAGAVKYFPYPVVSGFMSGVGLIIVLLQLGPLLGVKSPKSTWAVLQSLPNFVSEANGQALALGILTIGLYFVFPKVSKVIPSALVALVGATLAASVLGWNVPVIGDIPSGLPSFRLDALLSADRALLGLAVQFGMVLAVLGSIDSLLTSVIADNMTKTRHNSNRELIGQGIGNMLAAVIGGVPGAGATKGTVVNINAGGKTRLSGTIHGLFLLAVLLGLGSLASRIPLSVLAGLLIPIGFKIVDFKGLKHLGKVPKSDSAVLVIVLVLTTFGSLINAVGIGVALAALLFMKKAADLGERGLEVGPIADIDGGNPWPDEIEFYESYKDRVIIKHIAGPMFFGFTSFFKDKIKSLPEDIAALVVRFDKVPYIDQSGLYALEEAVLDLRQKDVLVVLVGLQEQPLAMMRAIDIVPDLVGEDALFRSPEEAFAHLRLHL